MSNVHNIRPMRAQHMVREHTEAHLASDGYLLMQPKIDGMRVLFHNGAPRTRSWKEWSNRYLRAFAMNHQTLIQGWDCEMIGGHTPNPTQFRADMSGLRSEDGSREFTLYLFDNFDPTWAHYPYETRFANCASELLPSLGSFDPEKDYYTASLDGDCVQMFEHELYSVKVVLCPTYIVRSMEEIDALEAQFLADGWEGAMLRRKGRGYKWNQSTTLEGNLTKVKRYKDFEARITEVYARRRNDNEATTNNLGLTSRSAHQDNKVELPYVGGFWVETLEDGVRHKVGVFKDISMEEKAQWWDQRDQLVGKIITMKMQDYDGGYDKPRTPVFLKFRDPLEL